MVNKLEGIKDLQRAAYQHLMVTHRDVVQDMIDTGLLGFDHYPNSREPDLSKPFYGGWVFRSDTDGAPFRSIEGTGSGAISFMVYDSWASSSMWHSSSFPNLHIAIYGDPTRSEETAFPHRLDGRERAIRIYEKLHPLFHDSSNSIHKFSTLDVISSVAGGGFSVFPVPDGDGLVRLNQIYNVHL
jgi:hypothetical protein